MTLSARFLTYELVNRAPEWITARLLPTNGQQSSPGLEGVWRVRCRTRGRESYLDGCLLYCQGNLFARCTRTITGGGPEKHDRSKIIAGIHHGGNFFLRKVNLSFFCQKMSFSCQKKKLRLLGLTKKMPIATSFTAYFVFCKHVIFAISGQKLPWSPYLSVLTSTIFFPRSVRLFAVRTMTTTGVLKRVIQLEMGNEPKPDKRT